jgi:hypothetical protein
MVEIGNACAGSKGRTVSAYPSSYRLTLILIIPAMIGVVTGHFEDKTMVAYCCSEVAIAPFHFACNIESALPQRGGVSPRRLWLRGAGDRAVGLFDDIGREIPTMLATLSRLQCFRTPSRRSSAITVPGFQRHSQVSLS